MTKPLSDPSSQDRRPSPVDASALVWAVPLGVWMPWRVFPTVRRMQLAPLAIVYVVSLAACVALTLHASWKGAGVTRTWQYVLIGQVAQIAWQFANTYVLATLCVASQRQRVPETLITGLKLALTSQASISLFGLVVWSGVSHLMAATPAWFGLLFLGLELYIIVAMALTAAWMADHDSAVDAPDPLWPGCIRCDYSLRGLPMAEAWLARQQAGSATVVAGDSPADCPECGLPIADSLREHGLRMQRGSALERTWPKHPHARTVVLGLLSLRFKPLAAWLVHSRQMVAVLLWLVAAAIATAVVVMPLFAVTPPGSGSVLNSALLCPYFWSRSLLWSGVAGLLAGLWFSRRARHNVIHLGQHALVPSVCLAGCILAVVQIVLFPILRITYFNVMFWFQQLSPALAGGHPAYLLLTPIVFVVQVALLRMVLGSMLSSRPVATVIDGDS